MTAASKNWGGEKVVYNDHLVVLCYSDVLVASCQPHDRECDICHLNLISTRQLKLAHLTHTQEYNPNERGVQGVRETEVAAELVKYVAQNNDTQL